MATMQSMTYEELEVGTQATFSKQLTERDIVMFAATSGDVNPVHLDEEYAKTTMFEGRIAHGMWSAGVISAAVATVMPGPGTVYIGQNLSFKRPVRIDDTLTVTLTVKEKLEKKQFVIIECVVTNQEDKAVVTGDATLMPPREKMTVEVPELPEITISN